MNAIEKINTKENHSPDNTDSNTELAHELNSTISLNKIPPTWCTEKIPTVNDPDPFGYGSPPPKPEEKKKNPVLLNFSLNGRSEEMEKQIFAEIYLLGRLAIIGQATIIFAPTGFGKTLLTIWMIVQALKAGSLADYNIFYINADDNLKGAIEKLKIAEKHGFEMIVPGHGDFNPSLFLGYLTEMTKDKTASNSVVIVDTLKKFSNLMDKRQSSEFMKVIRQFVSAGGTFVGLAHTNKHRDSEGKPVYQGTTDTLDDADCVFLMDATNTSENVRTVVFENLKSRGDVAMNACYTYSTAHGLSWLDRFNSIKKVGEQEQYEARQQAAISKKLEKNGELIKKISEAINADITLKSKLVQSVYDDSAESVRNIKKVLEEHTGISYSKGHRWNYKTGDKNSKIYHLLAQTYTDCNN